MSIVRLMTTNIKCRQADFFLILLSKTRVLAFICCFNTLNNEYHRNEKCNCCFNACAAAASGISLKSPSGHVCVEMADSSTMQLRCGDTAVLDIASFGVCREGTDSAGACAP